MDADQGFGVSFAPHEWFGGGRGRKVGSHAPSSCALVCNLLKQKRLFWIEEGVTDSLFPFNGGAGIKRKFLGAEAQAAYRQSGTREGTPKHPNNVDQG